MTFSQFITLATENPVVSIPLAVIVVGLVGAFVASWATDHGRTTPTLSYAEILSDAEMLGNQHTVFDMPPLPKSLSEKDRIIIRGITERTDPLARQCRGIEARYYTHEPLAVHLIYHGTNGRQTPVQVIPDGAANLFFDTLADELRETWFLKTCDRGVLEAVSPNITVPEPRTPRLPSAPPIRRFPSNPRLAAVQNTQGGR